jgi:hypothetical protein
MRNLRSYVQSWWYRDLGEDIVDDDAYDRFMDWMSDPTLVKPRNWRKYSKSNFLEDIVGYEYGPFIKHFSTIPRGTA